MIAAGPGRNISQRVCRRLLSLDRLCYSPVVPPTEGLEVGVVQVGKRAIVAV